MPVWRRCGGQGMGRGWAGDGQGMGSRAAAARLLQCAEGTEDRPVQRALEQRDHSVLATQRTGHADLRLHAHSRVLTDVAAGQGLRLLQATPGYSRLLQGASHGALEGQSP
jgi:hypothetical protein